MEARARRSRRRQRLVWPEVGRSGVGRRRRALLRRRVRKDGGMTGWSRRRQSVGGCRRSICLTEIESTGMLPKSFLFSVFLRA
ncbi:hypothetical protein KFK09_027755 [Dendrobium nobile]|uniref:Uncharacterized protein n=1 Tax=Dendrobium nobile TaxID=94219 RepID=A0A8T3A1K2_DENNO|nr:hypothetical protein KFK09_027755 [Dendrobium nobile]